MQLVRIVTVLGPAVVLAAYALHALMKPAAYKAGAALSAGLLTLGLAAFLNLSYPWFLLGYTIRTATLVLMLFAGLASVVTAVRVSSGMKSLIPSGISDWIQIAAAVIMLLVIPGMARNHPADEAISLASPFSSGTWYVVQGGGMKLVNHHYPVSEQRYSLDLVKLDAAGRNRLGPESSLESYIAWGNEVVAPVSGLVTTVIDGLPDIQIGERDPANAAGNHVVIDIEDGNRILLCHLRSGSVRVTEGHQVAQGEIVGEVGNSGNTSEPHLHIQGMRLSEQGDWYGVPLEIEGTVFHRGQLLRADH